MGTNNKSNVAAKLLFISGLSLIAFVFLNILISATLFIFKISISSFSPISSFVLTLGLIFYLLRKNKLITKKNCAALIVLILFVTLIIGGSIYHSGLVVDDTWDGNDYHKKSIGKLRDGWNPVYENLEDFDKNSSTSFGLTETNTIWENHYAKASHIFAANIYALTDNIETGKSINMISLVALVLICASYLVFKKKKLLFVVAFSLSVLTYSVFVAQMPTNYVDHLLGMYLFLLIFGFFIFEEKEFFPTHLESLALFFMTLCILINIKFSSFAYAGLYCLGYYIWYIYRLAKKKLDKAFFTRFTLIAFVAVIVGVFVIGLSVYPKNFIDHGHPFYPLFGEGKVDIMTANSPASFEDLSPIERFFHATFSECDNIIYASGAAPKLKIPFTYKIEEFEKLQATDLRISGHGVFFSGILLVSVLVLVCCGIFLKRKNPRLFSVTVIPLAITCVLTFALGESWWARYFPQLFLFALFALLYLDEMDFLPARIIKGLLIVIILTNNICTVVQTQERVSTHAADVEAQYEQFEAALSEHDGTVVFSTSFLGSCYNIRDRYGDEFEYQFHSEPVPVDYQKSFPLLYGYMTGSIENDQISEFDSN